MDKVLVLVLVLLFLLLLIIFLIVLFLLLFLWLWPRTSRGKSSLPDPAIESESRRPTRELTMPVCAVSVLVIGYGNTLRRDPEK